MNGDLVKSLDVSNHSICCHCIINLIVTRILVVLLLQKTDFLLKKYIKGFGIL